MTVIKSFAYLSQTSVPGTAEIKEEDGGKYRTVCLLSWMFLECVGQNKLTNHTKSDKPKRSVWSEIVFLT